MEQRHILNDGDNELLDIMKEALTKGIEELKERGVRQANIEIELAIHIKKLFKKELA